MIVSEFKAWFGGFTEGMDGPPDAKQWKRIQKRVGEIDGTQITEKIYVDRFVRPYREYRPYWGTPVDPWHIPPVTCGGVDPQKFESDPMYGAGRIEAMSMIGDGGSAG